jgi:hypothetical protein
MTLAWQTKKKKKQIQLEFFLKVIVKVSTLFSGKKSFSRSRCATTKSLLHAFLLVLLLVAKIRASLKYKYEYNDAVARSPESRRPFGTGGSHLSSLIH